MFGRVKQSLEAFVDSDNCGDMDTRQSTSGFVLLMNTGPVPWCSRKQGTVASSTVGAEYLACHAASKEGR